MVDKITNYFLVRSYESAMKDSPWTKTQGWVLLEEGKPQLLDVGPTIQDAVYKPQFKGYLYKQVRLIPFDFERIGQDVMRWKKEMSPDLYQIWSANQITGFFIVGNMMNIWGLR